MEMLNDHDDVDSQEPKPVHRLQLSCTDVDRSVSLPPFF